MTSSAAAKVAVIGSGISGAVCASTLAKNGIAVTVFEGARGPGGRMSQRREVSDDGQELAFDHGAPYFTATNPDVLSLIRDWEHKGLVADWNKKFGSFDCLSNKFIDVEEDGLSKRYVGVPGMNSICAALCRESGVESRYGVGVGKLEWLEDEDLWSLIGMDGEVLGQFKGVVASDKNTFSRSFASVNGRPPLIDSNVVPEMASKIKEEIPRSPCFALMLAFEKPLSLIPLKAFTLNNSDVLSWAYCDSSKPGRSTTSERWVLHSTPKYAEAEISRTGLGKISRATLTRVADELFSAFESTKLLSSLPFFRKAHRWGSAFPATSIAGEEKCLWDAKKRLAICGDFCVSPNVEGAILSGVAAATKFVEVVSCL